MNSQGDQSKKERIPVRYDLTSASEAFMYMTRMVRCWLCGHMIIDEPVEFGTMITCLTGDVYENGEAGCGTRWWIEER